MCTEDRLLIQMESYMDDLVDCFEAFVKKSMLVVSVAVGTLVLMVIYVLKLMSQRIMSREITDDIAIGTERFNSCCQVRPQQLAETIPSNAPNPSKKKKSFVNEFFPVGSTRTISLQVIPSTYPSYDETLMNEIDLGIKSKSLDTCKQTQVSEDLKSARTGSNFTRARQSSVTKSENHLSTSRRCSFVDIQNLERNSCCSMCCEDDERNQ